MNDHAADDKERSPSAIDRVRPLVRVRQIREFTPDPPSQAELDAITEVARWSGSSRNEQPCRFLVLRDIDILRRIAEVGMPQTRSLHTATAAVAITLPDEPEREASRAFDEGRAAERMMIAASYLDLGAAVTWVRADVRDEICRMLALPDGRFARTIVALGHPTDAARRPKSAPGQARLPRDEVISEGRRPGR